MDFIYEPWPWYFSGVMIALVMLLLTIVGKNFGMSSNLRTICTVCGAGNRTSFFSFEWKTQKWNLIVLLGTVIGGFIASQFLTENYTIQLNLQTIKNLETLGFSNIGQSYLPDELFSNHVFSNWRSVLILAIGGVFVGFGARYAGGCTSGHAISGLSNLQVPSLIAVIGFFIGGLIMIHYIFPYIF